MLIVFTLWLILNTSMVIAHAGDGNFHTVILFDPSEVEQRREAERLNHFMVHTALSMEGNNFTWECVDIILFSVWLLGCLLCFYKKK